MAGRYDGLYHPDDIKCVLFQNRLYRLYRKTHYGCSLTSFNVVYGKPRQVSNVNNNGTVLLI